MTVEGFIVAREVVAIAPRREGAKHSDINILAFYPNLPPECFAPTVRLFPKMLNRLAYDTIEKSTFI